MGRNLNNSHNYFDDNFIQGKYLIAQYSMLSTNKWL